MTATDPAAPEPSDEQIRKVGQQFYEDCYTPSDHQFARAVLALAARAVPESDLIRASNRGYAQGLTDGKARALRDCVMADENTSEFWRREAIQAWGEITQMRGAVLEALEFAESQADVCDGPEGLPQANKAMLLAQTLRASLAAAAVQAEPNKLMQLALVEIKYHAASLADAQVLALRALQGLEPERRLPSEPEGACPCGCNYGEFPAAQSAKGAA